MKREADAGGMQGSGGPTSPHKRYRQGDDELRLLIPSKVGKIKHFLFYLYDMIYCFHSILKYTDKTTISLGNEAFFLLSSVFIFMQDSFSNKMSSDSRSPFSD